MFKKLESKWHKILYEGMLLNWSSLDKAILVLILGGIDQFLWFFWCLNAYLNSDVTQWFDMEYLHSHIIILFCTLIGFFIFAWVGYKFKKNLLIQKYFVYFAIPYFSFVFLHGGYSIGIMSPATIAGYISLATVGLVLFERKIIYLTFLPISLLLISVILLSLHGYIQYAPTFSDEMNLSVVTDNEFWVYSMLYHYIPIFLCSIGLFEILLIQWRHREKQFNLMSKIDPLTGIFNRRSISDHLTNLQHEQRGYSIVLLDLDHFKNINDHYGHDAGDTVLKKVADILVQDLRENDIVGRFGGEEFVLILKEKHLLYAIEIAERCRAKIAQEQIMIRPKLSINVSASFGVSTAEKGITHDTVIYQADQALYLAKKNGRNQVQSYQDLLLQETVGGV